MTTAKSARLIRSVIDTQFACGEWRGGDDESYAKLHARAEAALERLEARIQYLEDKAYLARRQRLPLGPEVQRVPSTEGPCR